MRFLKKCLSLFAVSIFLSLMFLVIYNVQGVITPDYDEEIYLSVWYEEPSGSTIIDSTVAGMNDFFYYAPHTTEESGGNLNPVTTMPAANHPNEDLLQIYMSMIYRDPSTLFAELDQINMRIYENRREEWVEELLYIYEFRTRGDMINWFVAYELEISNMFSFTLPTGVILQAGLEFSLPALKSQFYTYMPIQAITSRTSFQWKFKEHLSTDLLGFKKYGSAYAVALGSYFGITIGGIYEMEFSCGEVIYAVLADCKKDSDTDVSNRYSPQPGTVHLQSGNIVEFVMDSSHFAEISSSLRVNHINRVIRTRFPNPVTRIKFLGVSEHAVVR